MIGAGRVGTALAVLLRRAGHRIVAVSGRGPTERRARRFLHGVPFRPPDEAAAAAHVVVIGTPDDLIAATAGAIAPAVGARHVVLHLSGSVPLSALEACRSAGAMTLSLHPLQTFPDVETAIARIPGSPVAVTAGGEPEAALGERLARDVGGEPFALPDERKAVYHAAAVFASNYLAVVEGVAERLFLAAGVEAPLETAAPLIRSSAANVLAAGPGAALTGPAARGDAGTVVRNLEALRAEAPDTVAAYAELARLAARMASDAGRLDADGVRRIEEAVRAWT